MAGTINREWLWDVSVSEAGAGEDGVKIIVWDSDSNTPVITQTTSGGGTIPQQQLQEAVYSVDASITTDDKTPHVISAVKFNLKPISLNITFDSARTDTIFMAVDPAQTESNKATVDAYTGIFYNHSPLTSNREIQLDNSGITPVVNVDQLYDHVITEAFDVPQKAYPEGAITTTDGQNYSYSYDVTIQGAFEFDGQNRAFIGTAPDPDPITFRLLGANANIKDITMDRLVIETGAQGQTHTNVNPSLVILNGGNSTTYTFVDSTIGTLDTDVTGVTVILNNSTFVTNADPVNITTQNAVSVRVTVLDTSGSPINGARVLLEADTGGPLPAGTDILSGDTNASGVIEDTAFNFTGNQPVTGRARKSTTSPFYKTGNIIGTITSTGFDVTIQLLPDE